MTSIITKLGLSIFFSNILNCIIYHFNKEISNDYHSRSTFCVFSFPFSNFKCNFIFFNFEFVTLKRNSKSLTIDLVTRSLFFYFELVTRKRKNKSSTVDLVTRNEIFFNFEFATRNLIFYFSTASKNIELATRN